MRRKQTNIDHYIRRAPKATILLSSFMPTVTAKARYWLLTIPHHHYAEYLPADVAYLRGQLERGAEGGYLHWQLLAVFPQQVRLGAVRRIFGAECHAEPSRSAAADAYVWKEDTAVAGTRFELGKRPIQLANKTDWDRVWESAVAGDLQAIPAGIRIRSYNSLKRIQRDHMAPVAIERTCHVFWGATGTGT